MRSNGKGVGGWMVEDELVGCLTDVSMTPTASDILTQ